MAGVQPPTGTTLSYIMVSSDSGTAVGADNKIIYGRYVMPGDVQDGVVKLNIAQSDAIGQHKTLWLAYSTGSYSYGTTSSYTRPSTLAAFNSGSRIIFPTNPVADTDPVLVPPATQWHILDTISSSDIATFGTKSAAVDLCYNPAQMLSTYEGIRNTHSHMNDASLSDQGSFSSTNTDPDILTTLSNTKRAEISLDTVFDPQADANYYSKSLNAANENIILRFRSPVPTVPIDYWSNSKVVCIGKFSYSPVGGGATVKSPTLWWPTGTNSWTARLPNTSTSITGDWFLFEWTISQADNWLERYSSSGGVSQPRGYTNLYLCLSTDQGANVVPNTTWAAGTNEGMYAVSYFGLFNKFRPIAHAPGSAALTITDVDIIGPALYTTWKPVKSQVIGPNYQESHNINLSWSSKDSDGNPINHVLAMGSYKFPTQVIGGQTVLDLSPLRTLAYERAGLGKGEFSIGGGISGLEPGGTTISYDTRWWGDLLVQITERSAMTLSMNNEFGADRFWSQILAGQRNIEPIISISNSPGIQTTASVALRCKGEAAASWDSASIWPLVYGAYYRVSFSFPKMGYNRLGTDWGVFYRQPKDYSFSGTYYGLDKTNRKTLMYYLPGLPVAV